MPKTKKRVLDVELDMSLQITVQKRCEVGPEGENRPSVTAVVPSGLWINTLVPGALAFSKRSTVERSQR